VDSTSSLGGRCHASYNSRIRSPISASTKKILDFFNIIAELSGSTSDPEHGLLEFALRFRHRVAVRPRDKLFGFRGLLTSTNSPSVDIDYHKSTQNVFAEFAASNILRMRDLTLVTLAEPYHWSGATWSVDWENMTSSDWKEYSPLDFLKPEIPNMFWNGGLVYSDVAFIRNYNACGGLRPSFKYKSEEDWGKLIVKGWQADTVATVGPVFDEETPFGQTQNKSKELAGASWTHGAVEREMAFNRTVTGDAWQEICHRIGRISPTLQTGKKNLRFIFRTRVKV
ncbi:MAG: hypothetical protein Q9201_003124, partial [Fulgogasparrea decipioides]